MTRRGWIKIDNAVPFGLCARLVGVLEHELNVHVHDSKRWGEFGGEMLDFPPIRGSSGAVGYTTVSGLASDLGNPLKHDCSLGIA